MHWSLKIIIKIIISRLPISYSFWRKLGLFRHGHMDSIEYPLKIFNLHIDRAFPDGIPPDAVILELGPGDSATSALLGYAHKASRIYLVDVGDYIRKDIDFYRLFSNHLKEYGFIILEFENMSTIEDMLSTCNTEYMTRGISSLKNIPSASVDYIWSHSVLEHVRKAEFGELLEEFKRIMKPQALASHNIDFQDHLSHALNNLRFSESTWESTLFSSSGFYTNRIPATSMHSMFRDAQFTILQENFGCWPKLPTPRKSLHSDFASYSDEELINRTSSVLMQKC